MTFCNGCGKPIVWGEAEGGKKIPLDPRAPVYALSRTMGYGGVQPIIRLQKDEAMVSHFATCPHANEFSGKNKSVP